MPMDSASCTLWSADWPGGLAARDLGIAGEE
eukprot:CAMPEP_0168435384 /NCGR_PEP_ID=MMETSP0228-20121227/40388_1 /TAXON_ID=133427 /ORGANISM="Protoceratium reticulatum, Strain CCCM 535 (=CCMP 1889)" /LENGTH=30 /DNA_ID= /DNA_START= /DNA_END= /DNA_ORIENTATION=